MRLRTWNLLFVGQLMNQLDLDLQLLNAKSVNKVEKPRRTWLDCALQGFERAEVTNSCIAQSLPRENAGT